MAAAWDAGVLMASAQASLVEAADCSPLGLFLGLLLLGLAAAVRQNSLVVDLRATALR